MSNGLTGTPDLCTAPAVDTFAEWHVTSGDIDPAYPVLRWVVAELELDADDLAAFLLLYVAYYNLSSALRAWLEGWRPGMTLTDAQLRYATGVERRGHRDVAEFARHIASLNRWIARHPSAASMLHSDLVGVRNRWDALQVRFGSIHGNGRWAGYKFGELADYFGYGFAPPDAGHAHSSGPRKGLGVLFPDANDITGHSPADIVKLDRLTERLVQRWQLPVAQVETILCDWHSTVHGGYYVGHDIDMMLSALDRNDHAKSARLLKAARLNSFDHRWLGEVQGWGGIRKPLKRLWLDTGKVVWW